MNRLAIACLACLVSCGRSQGVANEDLGNLVTAPDESTAPLKAARAATEVSELTRAFALPFATLGTGTLDITMTTQITEAGKPTSELGETTVLELGDKGAYHGLYTNTADYGREVTFDGTSLFLRPRYQRWHQRAPESPVEPSEQRDKFSAPLAATWELFAPAVELANKGPASVAGREGVKVQVAKSPKPGANPPERLSQRKWREARVIEDITGEVVLDNEKAVPLAVSLTGTISFMRDGRRFQMKVALKSDTKSTTAVAIAAPPPAEVVATPERLREVDDRDTLLQGIAPASRKQNLEPATPAAGSAQ